MRILILNLLAAALILFGATSASAWAVNMAVRQSSAPLSSLDVSDTVTVDVFFDATGTNINLFTTSVINTNAASISYDPVASAALPIIHPAPSTAYGTQGDQPGYILYAPGASGMPPLPSTALYPQQTPWQLWVAPPAGAEQININYAEANITDTIGTQVTGTGIWIASLVFHVDAPFDNAELLPTMTIGPMILELADGSQIPNESITVSAPVALSGVSVPEPTSAALIGLGLLGLAITGRRRS